MPVSDTTIFFRTIDYKVFQNGYLFKLMDTDRHAEYKLAFAPFSLYPSVLMLDFILADTGRSATINDDLVNAVREELSSGNLSEIVILGSRDDESGGFLVDPSKVFSKTDGGGILLETGEGTRITNRKKLQTVSNVSFSRDIINGMGKLSESDVAFRIDNGCLIVDKMDSANREYVSGLDIATALQGARPYRFGGSVSSTLGTYFRPYRVGASINGNSITSSRTDVFGLSNIGSSIISSRTSSHNGFISEISKTAHRDIRKGIMYTDHNPLDFYVEVIPRYLKVMRPEILANRIINNSNMTALDNKILADRNVSNDMFVKKLLDSTKILSKDTHVENSIALGKKKAPQYPSHMHYVGEGDRLNREDVYFQAVGDALRDIVGGDLVKSYDTLRFERDISNALDIIRDKVLGDREIQQNREVPTVIEQSMLKAYRDIFDDMFIQKELEVGSRFYLVKAFVDENRPQGIRKYDNVLHLSHNQPQGSRDVLQNSHLHNTKYDNVVALRDYSHELMVNVSDEFTRDNKSGLLLPKEQHQAYRSDKSLDIQESVDSTRVNGKQTHLATSTIWERDSIKELLLLNSQGYERDSEKSMHIEYSKTYERVKRKLMHLRDEWLDILINGGELPENDTWEGLLMEDMIFGELLDSPAWVEECQILGDHNNSKIGVITADFLEGTKQKIQALLDSGILLSTREGDIAGDIIAINYEAMVDIREGQILEGHSEGTREEPEAMVVEYPDLMADKVTIPKYGWLDELENPLGYIEDREGQILSENHMATRPDSHGYVEDDCKLATRPDMHNGDLTDNTVLADRGSKDGAINDDDRLATRVDYTEGGGTESVLASRVETEGTVLDNVSMAGKGERDAVLEESGSKAGSLWNRESSLMDNIKNMLGTLVERVSSIFKGSWMGTKDNHEALSIDESSTIGTKADHEGITIKDSETMGSQFNRDGVLSNSTIEGARGNIQATVDDADYTGYKTERDAELDSEEYTADIPRKHATLEEMQFAELKGRLANAIVDFIFAHSEEKEVEGLNAIITAVKQDRAFTLMSHLEGYREERHGVVDEQIQATPEKLGDVIQGILATPEKYGIHMDGSALGQGVLHDYNDDLLKEGTDVEYWGDSYGFGVPDDYDPLDPFNNYYPYTSDYTSHELTQKVSWTKTDGFNFKPDTDIIQLDTDKDSIAVADVSGDNYKFAVDFCVKGNKDTAVDIVVRYTDKDNYYIFRINGGDRAGTLNMTDNMQLYKVQHGVYSPVGYPMSPHQWKKNTWHRVEVSVMENGTKLLIKVDDRVQYDMRGY